MSKMIYSTKNTQRHYLLSNIISDGVLCGGISWWLFNRADELSRNWYRDAANNAAIIGTIVLICGIAFIAYRFFVASTRLDYYNDHISGSGLQGFQKKSFDLHWDQVSDLSTSSGILGLESHPGIFLVVNTPTGNYKIMTTKQYAKEITEYYKATSNK